MIRRIKPLACSLALPAGLATAPLAAHADQFFATQVISNVPGNGQSSSFSDPTLALGAPAGGGTVQGSLDVYNLGVGNAAGTIGTLTLGFSTASQPRVIRDLPGADFVVFENPLYDGGNPHASFAELMFVSVSSDGVHFATFPTTSNTPSSVGSTGTIDPANVSGFAGVHPVMANVNDPTSPSPFNTASIDDGGAGGDAFDLFSLVNDPLVTSGQVDLQNILYVKVTDVLGNGTVLDSHGQPIYDPTGAGNNGADVDAVAVINGAVVPEPCAAGLLLGVAGTIMLKRTSLRE